MCDFHKKPQSQDIECTVDRTDSQLRTQAPRGSSTYFVSHDWESDDHPDNDEGTKLAWLQMVKSHLRIFSDREIWIWLDFFSIPQKNRHDQNKAILSLPHYTQLCTRILPLVRDADRWEELYNKQPSEIMQGIVRGDIGTYYQQGWCDPKNQNFTLSGVLYLE